MNVEFEENTLQVPARNVSAPKRSAIVDFLVNKGIAKDQNQGEKMAVTSLLVLLIIVALLLYKFGLAEPKINTRKNYRPAVSLPIYLS